MALKDYVAPSRHVALKGCTFDVEGVSLEPLAVLVRTNLPELEQLYELAIAALDAKSKPTDKDLESIALILAERMPKLVASIIALASGDNSPESVAAARRLPAPVQIDVLKTIAELTFEEVGGIKKFGLMLMGMLKVSKPIVPPKKTRR